MKKKDNKCNIFIPLVSFTCGLRCDVHFHTNHLLSKSLNILTDRRWSPATAATSLEVKKIKSVASFSYFVLIHNITITKFRQNMEHPLWEIILFLNGWSVPRFSQTFFFAKIDSHITHKIFFRKISADKSRTSTSWLRHHFL